MSGPYGQHAGEYFAAGITALPMKPLAKVPAVRWKDYASSLPDIETQQDWVRRLGNCGIAICTGTVVYQGKILVAIDVDDDALVRVTQLILGDPVCAKRGCRGITFFCLAEPSVKSGKLKDAEGIGKIDILAEKRLTVLPPTIHPKTNRPYEWIGKPLLECSYNEFPLLR